MEAMEAITQLLGQCAAQSTGFSNQLFALLIRTLLFQHCAISPPDMWPKDYGPTAIEKGLINYDFIVVGAGSAGSVVASRLSENKDWNVLLLEAGGDPPHESEIPMAAFQLLNTEHSWNHYVEKSDKASKSIPTGDYWPSGKLLGGSSSINAMLYVRGNRRDYDGWKAAGNPTWDYEEVTEYFKRSENMKYEFNAGNEKFHSTKGPWKINHYWNLMPIKSIVFDGAVEAGYKELRDINGDQNIGFCASQGAIHDGVRQSLAKAFLIPAKDRKNLHIIKHANVTKVLLDDKNRAYGVEFSINGGKKMEVKTQREVILSAGAVNSAKLLMLSGIGAKSHLAEHKIEVKQDLPIGNNLQDHIYVPIFLSYHESRAKPLSEREIVDYAYSFWGHRVGPIGHPGSIDMVGFVDTLDKNGKFPDIQYHFINFEKKHSDIKIFYKDKLGYADYVVDSIVTANEKAHNLAVLVTILNPKSRGTIRLRSADFNDPPIIDPNYLDDEDDVKTIIRGIRTFQKLYETKIFKGHEFKEIKITIPECDQIEYGTDEYYECYVRHLSKTCYHPVGTAKMAPKTDPESVVSYDLKVNGVKTLRVIDASIMPTIVSGNTMAPSVMIAEKGADFIKDDWSEGCPFAPKQEL